MNQISFRHRHLKYHRIESEAARTSAGSLTKAYLLVAVVILRQHLHKREDGRELGIIPPTVLLTESMQNTAGGE